MESITNVTMVIKKKVEEKWNNDKNKILIRGLVTEEAANFLEECAFNDFGMMKKGAIGMELTKLILLAKEYTEKKHCKCSE